MRLPRPPRLSRTQTQPLLNGLGLLSPAVLLRQRIRIDGFTARRSTFYTAFENKMKRRGKPPVSRLCTVTIFFLLALGQQVALGQAASQKPAEKPAAKSPEKTGSPEKTENPAQIELLETKVRFEANGDSRKEVHALVKINSELGVRQFARLNFDFNRSFESIEIPLVHITHASGGTADILPGAITDQPNPAVVNAPAYQDVRVKSVRILGLQPGDTLEYRVVRTISHYPLAPDFWFDHTFDRTGVVSEEIFHLDLPAQLQIKPKINPETPFTSSSREGQRNEARVSYRWQRRPSSQAGASDKPETNEPDVSLTTFKSWDQLADRLATFLVPTKGEVSMLREKAFAISGGAVDGETGAIYDFVSKQIRTVDLPLGVTGYRRRKPMEILDSGYGSAEDKFVLFAAMLGIADAGFVSDSNRQLSLDPASPADFNHLLTFGYQVGMSFWLDLNMEVAPEGMIPPQFRDKPIFVVGRNIESHWQTVPNQLIYRSSQKVSVTASLDADGKLTAKVRYTMRGDNELVLRVAFHQTPKEKWKGLAQLLSITDGFRGQVSSVNASDPYATKEPFTLEYELEQPKFVNWSKKAARIPALLPQLGLPDAPGKPAAGPATAPIELDTPLEVETRMTLNLPPGTTATTPTGTSVDRDYAAYSSQYSANGPTLTASRHIKFLLREVPGTRAADYNAFIRAVQSDEAQDFSLERPETSAPKTNSAAPHSTAPPKPTPPKP